MIDKFMIDDVVAAAEDADGGDSVSNGPLSLNDCWIPRANIKHRQHNDRPWELLTANSICFAVFAAISWWRVWAK